MQIESLKIFCDVARWSSFSRGAAENGISQSSASQAVLQLESRLGVKLIDRSKRPLVLTAAGKLYFEECKELMDRFLDLENRVRAFEQESRIEGTVGVAAIYSVGMHHMSRYVRTFEERNPRAMVRVEYHHPDRVLDKVTRGEVELGLLSCPKKWSDLTVLPWREEPMVLAVAPEHRLAGRESVTATDIDGESFIAFDSNLPIRRLVDRFLKYDQVETEVVHEFDNIENVKRAVEIAAGISILPEPCVAKEVASGSLIAIPILNSTGRGLVRPLAVIHKRSAPLDLAARAFLDLLLRETYSSSGASCLASVDRGVTVGSTA